MHDDPAVLRLQWERLRAMSTEERAKIVDELTAAVEALAVAGIRAAHPTAGEREVFLRLAVRKLGHKLAREAYPEIDGIEGLAR